MKDDQKERTPLYSLWGAIFQVLFLCPGLYFLLRHPAPGIAVTILGVAAVVMAVRANRFTKMEEIIWIVIAVALSVAEIQAIRKDRADAYLEQQQIRKEENEKFAMLLEDGRVHFEATIRQSQNQFAVNMTKSAAILNRVSDSINTNTGGNSFAYITLSPEPRKQFAVVINSHGKYPLREVSVLMMDDRRRILAMEEYNKHPDADWIRAIQSADTQFRVSYLRPQSPEAPMGDVEILGAYPFFDGASANLSIAFSSLNGYWNERLHLRKINGKWVQALSVVGPTAESVKHPFIYFDPEYRDGKSIAQQDWRVVKPTKRRRAGNH